MHIMLIIINFSIFTTSIIVKDIVIIMMVFIYDLSLWFCYHCDSKYVRFGKSSMVQIRLTLTQHSTNSHRSLTELCFLSCVGPLNRKKYYFKFIALASAIY